MSCNLTKTITNMRSRFNGIHCGPMKYKRTKIIFRTISFKGYLIILPNNIKVSSDKVKIIIDRNLKLISISNKIFEFKTSF